jgi:ABC-type antimicrobial peptide transport system permease subunit
LFVDLFFFFFHFDFFFLEKLFLDQIFGSVMAVLVVLGSMLIYSLLLGNVSDKTYEYGMLRALGFERNSLIGLLFVTSMFFTLPGIGLGLLAAWLLWVPVSLILAQLTNAPTEYSLDYSSIILGVVVGFVMPIVANIGPIRRALSRTLRDSLDVYHNVQNETTVRMVKLKGMGLSVRQLVISVIMIVVGFLVYYLIPYAFTYNNFALFLGVLQVILLSMVLGLCLVASTTQPFIERGVLWLIVWGSDAKLLGLMDKNMSAHRPRNQKTALMFTLSLGFMIFAGASFSLQAATIADTVSSVFGADINFFAPSWSVPLPEETIRSALRQEMNRSGTLLRGWAFASFALRGSTQRVFDTRLSNLAGEPNRQIQVYGLEANHLDVVYSRFYQLAEADKSVKFNTTANNFVDVVKSLTVNAGQQTLPDEAPPFRIPDDIFLLQRNGTDGKLQELSKTNNNTLIYSRYIDVVVSESMRYASTVSTSTPLRLFMLVRDFANEDRRFFFLAKARGMVSKLPGFFVSSYRQTATNSPLFVSMNSFADLTDVVDSTMELSRPVASPFVQYRNVSRNVPKANLWVKMDAAASTRETQEMIDRLRAAINDDRMQSVNIRALVEGTGTASNAMLIFFYVVAVINSILAFFLLWQSFDANVRFNGWEVGVIRSLGVTTGQVVRLYVYEAIAVVFTAIALGLRKKKFFFVLFY